MRNTCPSLRYPALLTLAALAAGCASLTEAPEPVGPLRKETIHALTQDMTLLTFNAGQPARMLQRTPVTGLSPGDRLVGLDYRVARGVLYALSRAGRLYTLDVKSGALSPVNTTPPALAAALDGTSFGVDFNPVADRIRVVSNTGQNLRLHPDTGAVAATDPPAAYAPADAQAGRQPDLVAAAYTYNKTNDKLTTNYALDRRAGTLVIQGSVEGTQPVISPNTGQLKTMGVLGVGPFLDAAMDIADISGVAYAALQLEATRSTRLYQINLATGQAEFIGTVAKGVTLVGMAVEP